MSVARVVGVVVRGAVIVRGRSGMEELNRMISSKGGREREEDVIIPVIVTGGGMVCKI